MDKQAYYPPISVWQRLFLNISILVLRHISTMTAYYASQKRLFLITMDDFFRAVLLSDEVLFGRFDNLMLFHICIFSIEMSNSMKSINSVSL